MCSSLSHRHVKSSVQGKLPPLQDESDIVTIRFIAIVFALVISITAIVGFANAWPTFIIVFDLLFVVSACGGVIFLLS